MPSKTIEDFAYQVRDYMRSAEVVEGKNLAYSQENNAVIATIENGKSYKVRWTGSATVTLKKNSASGTEVTSGSTSPLSFTADSDFDLYFGSSADVTEIMVYDGNDTSDTYEPYYVPVKDRVDELENVEDVTSKVTFSNNVVWKTTPAGWNSIYRCGKVVHGNIRFNTPATVSSDLTVLTFPDELMPASPHLLLGSLIESGNNWTGANCGTITYIGNGNNFGLGYDGWQANKEVCCTFCYLTK